MDICTRPMVLNDTVKYMNSDDYVDRFKAEYFQLNIRHDKLVLMLERWDNGTLSFIPTCPREFYNLQEKAMSDYIKILKARAAIENIDLNDLSLKE